MVICPGDKIVLDPGVFDEYQWQDGSVQATFSASEPGIYVVTVFNQCGSARDEVRLTEGACTPYFPGAFTPNGDLLNDEFKILNAGAVQQFRLVVYNRFGQRVFETTNPSKGWNGMSNGIPCDAGTFVWVCHFSISGETQFRKGTVTLLR
jgi:gliding motility-associated-like protein